MARRHTSKSVSPTPLAEPLHLEFSSRTVPNRILKSALTEHLATWDPSDRSVCGIPGHALETLYNTWGQGNVGLLITGNVMVDPDHLETEGNMIVPPQAVVGGRDAGKEADRFAGFENVAAAGKANGSLVVAQINHPGRQTFKRLQERPISASAVQLGPKNIYGTEFAEPRAATQQEIREIVSQFVHCAAYLEAAGFDGVQLHGAHGYLLAQFLSQTTNLRTDEYGGSLGNRVRIIAEIARGIRLRCKPDFVLGIKMNSVEFQEHGLQPEEARQICQLLEQEKFDFVELSGGTYEEIGWEHKKESTKIRESYFLQWADLIAPAIRKTKIFITGGFKTAGGMVSALETVDGVGLGRTMGQEPHLAGDLISGRVDGAIQGVFGDDQLALTVMICGTQMMQMSEGKVPFDASRPEKAEQYVEALGIYMEELKAGKWSPWPAM